MLKLGLRNDKLVPIWSNYSVFSIFLTKNNYISIASQLHSIVNAIRHPLWTETGLIASTGHSNIVNILACFWQRPKLLFLEPFFFLKFFLDYPIILFSQIYQIVKSTKIQFLKTYILSTFVAFICLTTCQLSE